jgi:hypothetical protein
MIAYLSSRRAKSLCGYAREFEIRLCLAPYREGHQIDLSGASVSPQGSIIAYLSSFFLNAEPRACAVNFIYREL